MWKRPWHRYFRDAEAPPTFQVRSLPTGPQFDGRESAAASGSAVRRRPREDRWGKQRLGEPVRAIAPCPALAWEHRAIAAVALASREPSRAWTTINDD